MNEIIKITEKNGRSLVSARELYEVLGLNKTAWSRWYKTNIIENPFAIEYEDWEGFDIVSNGNNTMDFVISIDFAKRLSMMTKTEKGERIRSYFIEMEKQARKGIPVKSKNELILEAMQLLQESVQEEREKRIEAEKRAESKELELMQAHDTIIQQAPKVEYCSKVLESEKCWTTTTIAKELGMGAPTLNKKLHEMKIQYKHEGTWVLYCRYQGKGYTQTRSHIYHTSQGDMMNNIQTVWTEKGRVFIHSLFNESLKHNKETVGSESI